MGVMKMTKEKEGDLLLEEAAGIAAKENPSESWDALLEVTESIAKEKSSEGCDCYMM